MTPRYATVIFDADSTLATIEGIDWLGALRGPAVAQEIARLTAEAMDGRISIDAAYAPRVALIAPTGAELDALSDAYVAAIVPEARETVRALQDAGIRVIIVSGGLEHALRPMAAQLGVASDDLFAVRLRADATGAFTAFAGPQLLATQVGKPQLVASLGLPRPILMVGDGSTDAAVRGIDGATFVAFTGVVRREAVVAQADHVITSLADLLPLVFA
jgi:HAD superfamily phosphoserine phosphatase-like hydrolase